MDRKLQLHCDVQRLLTMLTDHPCVNQACMAIQQKLLQLALHRPHMSVALQLLLLLLLLQALPQSCGVVHAPAELPG